LYIAPPLPAALLLVKLTVEEVKLMREFAPVLNTAPPPAVFPVPAALFPVKLALEKAKFIFAPLSLYTAPPVP
jgi:hypothetical protein